MSIEEKMEKLDEILKEIEDPKTGLEKSVEKYSQACLLVKECCDDIKKCDGKIIEISEDLKMVDFDEDK